MCEGVRACKFPARTYPFNTEVPFLHEASNNQFAPKHGVAQGPVGAIFCELDEVLTYSETQVY